MENKKNRIAMGVVLYEPSYENIKNVQKYLEMTSFDMFYVFDNSPECDESFQGEKVLYFWSGQNCGLSIPYNKMIERCIDDKIAYLCLMDQDTIFPSSEIKKIIDFINSNESFLERYAIIAPRSYLPNTNSKARSNNVSEAKYVINSGSFLNIKLFKNFGIRYDTDVFLDGVDFEVGMQIRNAGLKIGVYENSVFVQNIGYVTSENEHFVKHSSERYKYIAHNKVYIYQKHYGAVRGRIMATLINLRLVMIVFLYEDNKVEKIKAIISEVI